MSESSKRRLNFLIFFSIVLSVYFLVNYYIFIRGYQALSFAPGLQFPYIILFLILSLSFIAGRFLERASLSWFSSLLVWIGSFWLGAMVYFFFSVVLLDIIRLINFIIPFYPSFILLDYDKTKFVTLIIVTGIVIIIIIAGFINALHPRIKTLNLEINKNSSLKSLKLAVVSDIHLGTIICKSRLERIVKIINSLNPDIVLLPGDVVDEDIAPVIKQNLGETLRKIKYKMGVFAVTGNHEYIGGVEKACKYLEEHGISMLRDRCFLVNHSLYIAGREDRSIKQFAGKRRKPLEEVLQSVDKNLPVILMDHQPLHFEEALQNRIDLQLSGHTHHGQLWPFNYITKKVYELSWGYVKKGNTHFYVSCGAGTWGPPVRTGHRPEIVNINLKFGD